MPILKRASTVAFAGAAAAAVIGLSAATFASPTFTIAPGGATTGSAASATVTDTTTNNSLSCASTLHVTLKSGSDLAGKNAGSVTGLSFSGCTVDGASITVTATNLPWALNLSSYNATKGIASGAITGIHANLSGPLGCSGEVDGTAATAHNGKVKFSYSNKGGKLTVLKGGDNLHAYNVTSCFGVVNSGDALALSAAYKVTPKQTITSP